MKILKIIFGALKQKFTAVNLAKALNTVFFGLLVNALYGLTNNIYSANNWYIIVGSIFGIIMSEEIKENK